MPSIFPQDIGEYIYSLGEVVSEIRDRATRERLQVLPYDLRLKNPSPEAFKIGMSSVFAVSA